MKLADYLDTNKKKPADFAREIGVNERESVRRYLAGTRIPTPTIMRRITQATNGAVQPNDFVLADLPK